MRGCDVARQTVFAMSVGNALAGVAVGHLGSAKDWYASLIGHAGRQPMAGLVEWSLPRGGVLQVFEDAGRAGSSSVTLSVTGLDRHVARLSERGVEIRSRTDSDRAGTAILQDPDGNQVVLAEPHSGDVAR